MVNDLQCITALNSKMKTKSMCINAKLFSGNFQRILIHKEAILFLNVHFALNCFHQGGDKPQRQAYEDNNQEDKPVGTMEKFWGNLANTVVSSRFAQ